MARGNHGEQNRRGCKKGLFRPPNAPGFSWKFPKSIKEEWPPFILETKRNLILSDIHIPFHDPQAIHCAIKHGKRKKPDAVIINGDLADFYAISKFDKNPTKAHLTGTIIDCRNFLGWLRGEFPKARIIFKLGNHDEWWEKYLWRKAPELIGLPNVTLEHTLTADFTEHDKAAAAEAAEKEMPVPAMFGPNVSGIEFVDEQRRIMLGALPVLHGHELPRGMTNPVNFARGMFLRATNHLLCGHSHQISQHTAVTLMEKTISTWSTGCFCGLRPQYARINQYAHGFAEVEVHEGHDFNVQNYRIISGKIF